MKNCKQIYCNENVEKNKKYCFKHQCRNKDCLKSNRDCDAHYCRPKITSCGEPVKNKGDFCSKHSCPTCKISRYECKIHFCQDHFCKEKKKMNSEYCEKHTCRVCNGKWPCQKHVCDIKHCNSMVKENLPFCTFHSLEDIINIDVVDQQEYIENIRYYWNNHSHNFFEYNSVHNYDELIELIKKHKMQDLFSNIFNQINKEIKLSDSKKYDLMCHQYCSYGYCNCDIMPRLQIDHFNKKEVLCIEEEVYLLSENVRTHDEYSPSYMGWTIPKIYVDEFYELWDGSVNQIKNMICFEYLK